MQFHQHHVALWEAIRSDFNDVSLDLVLSPDTFFDDLISRVRNGDSIEAQTAGHLNINLFSKSAYAHIQTVGGSIIDTATIRAWLNSRNGESEKATKFDAGDMAFRVTFQANSKISYHDNYDEMRSDELERRGELTYFASRKFVEWASPETLARLIGTSIFDDGATAKSEAIDVLVSEFVDFFNWYANQTEDSDDSILSKLFPEDSIVSEVVHAFESYVVAPLLEHWNIPFVEPTEPAGAMGRFEAFGMPIAFYRSFDSGSSATPVHVSGTSTPSPHFGFSIRRIGGDRIDDPLNHAMESLVQLFKSQLELSRHVPITALAVIGTTKSAREIALRINAQPCLTEIGAISPIEYELVSGD
jgi:hypothetical protein